MSVFLGIDTGGTYTDAALFDEKRGVISTAKSLTTKHDLSIGIRKAVQMVLPHPHPAIQLVSLSSTLATNAIVEGKGNPLCLLLIGYESQSIEDMGFEKLVADKNIVFIAGGHTVEGEEKCPLDIKTARQAILDRAPSVTAFAISGFFGVYNPTHELRVRRLVHNLTDLPATCGHELTTQLDAPLRALTVTLNARLISLMQQLILKVHEFLETQGIRAPLMIVKGDGSLMDASMALKRPVEVILSGPAASVVGGLHLCAERDALVIDMGGTTTDIAIVHNGYPVLNPKGARVGGWQTMVETMDIHTTGLGGDSDIHLDEAGKLVIGPRRVVPLSLLAVDYPSVLDVLKSQLEKGLNGQAGRFVMRERLPEMDQDNLASSQHKIWELLGKGPAAITKLFDGVEIPKHFRYSLDGLIEQGLVTVSAFTPTDAVHVLGQYRHGSVEAATLGARLWAQRLGLSEEEFCKKVIEQVILQAGHTVIESALAGENGVSLGSQDKVGRLLVNRALGVRNGGSFEVALSFRRPFIGIGAPANTYLTPLAQRLKTQLRIPEHAEVANAIGAVAGGVVQKVQILIRQPWGEEGVYRVYLPFGVRDFEELATAADHAQKTARRLARQHALEAGASEIRILMERHDHIIPVINDRLYLGTEITATAAGRPRLKE